MDFSDVIHPPRSLCLRSEVQWAKDSEAVAGSGSSHKGQTLRTDTRTTPKDSAISKRGKGSRRRQWKPLSLDAIEETPPEITTNYFSETFEQPFGSEAVVSDALAIHGVSRVTATEPLPAASNLNPSPFNFPSNTHQNSHFDDLQQLLPRPTQNTAPPSKQRKRRRNNRKKSMAAPDYIPPHLRNRGKSAKPDAAAPVNAPTGPRASTVGEDGEEKLTKQTVKQISQSSFQIAPITPKQSSLLPHGKDGHISSSSAKPATGSTDKTMHRISSSPSSSPIHPHGTAAAKDDNPKPLEEPDAPADNDTKPPNAQNMPSKPNGLDTSKHSNGWNNNPKGLDGYPKPSNVRHEGPASNRWVNQHRGNKWNTQRVANWCEKQKTQGQQNGWGNSGDPQPSNGWNNPQSSKDKAQPSNGWDNGGDIPQASNGAPGWGNNLQQSNGWQAPDSADDLNQKRAKRSPWAKPPKKTVWVKNRDLKPDPLNYAGNGGATIESNSEGDPDYHIKKLVDWSGNWQPPPLGWEGRRGYTNRHLNDDVRDWIDGLYSLSKLKAKIDTSDPDFLEAKKTIAQRHWVPTNIEGESAQQFWRTFLSRAPAPVDNGDIDGPPWWETFTGPGQVSYLSPLNALEAQLDPTDPSYEAAKRDAGTTANLKRREDEKKEKARKAAERRNRRVNRVEHLEVCPDAVEEEYVRPDRTLKPTANIYLRPAYAADVKQITDLYNLYVKNSIKTAEFKELTPVAMGNRLADVVSNGLPWIVAIQRGGSGKDKQTRQGNYAVTEKVVGFADLEHHCHPGSMYRHTTELELYVHPDYLRQGVGKCLLDRMLALADTRYIARGGPQWIVRDDYLESGCQYIVKVINVHVVHEHLEEEEINWITSFLKQFKFRKAGHLKNMGYKYGKITDVTIYQIVTGEPILNHTPANPY
ncbi:hypothetical protein GQ43DRAFT_472957 [Delitschia confertaspora ATCC 74209]|uniref:N-acetyltransferase domain-containing protein n=1 Tax=Delitschia confertaspora ATCC 74209 TaxID=1513339 RepID=A0A9P4MUK4_9PLEO|nr:hypothetical protein GQ43DRAFT_472957 [Delitschia confertaspora ATCC 74209]